MWYSLSPSCFPVPVTVWSALPEVKVRDREEIKNGLDVLQFSCASCPP